MEIQSVHSLTTRRLFDYYFATKKIVQESINGYPHKELLGMKTEELTDYLYQRHALAPLEIDETRSIEWEPVVTKEQRQDLFGQMRTVEVTYVKVIFPIKPTVLNIRDGLKYPANSGHNGVYNFDLNEADFTVSVQIDLEYKKLDQAISEYQELFATRTAEIHAGNSELRGLIPGWIEQRKKKIIEDSKMLDALIQKVPISLKRREETTDYKVSLRVRADLRRLSHPQSVPLKQLVLTQETLDSIIEIIDRSGKDFENTPESFTKLDEPDLRNIIATHLNSHFPGDVTGETFVKLGKTDIRLKVVEGEILIAECKYWGGEEEYAAAIDQLFRYLTWRYNYGLIIIFSKNYGFTGVLGKIKAATQKHPSYHGGFTELGKSHFRSIHTFPDDPQKQVEIHILAYTLYYNKDKALP